MASSPSSKFGHVIFFATLAGLAVLPLVPELCLFFRQQNDLKQFIPVLYYECIVSFLLLSPALWLPGLWSRGWVLIVGLILMGSTLIVGFQAMSIGAQWDLTAHSALMQTYPQQAWDFSRFFGLRRFMFGLVALLLAFVACIILNLRSTRPAPRAALLWTIAGLLLSSLGLYNAVRYGRHLFRDAPVAHGGNLRIITPGINNHHPVTRLALTHHNYRVTHAYYIAAWQQATPRLAALKGAQPVPGAVLPRIVLVVLGESAGRRHWSLYGYARETTPQLAALGAELLVYDDAISDCVGTQAAMRAMFDIPTLSLPVFQLFSNAGYQTHWFSTKNDQGHLDVEITALVQSCDERVYLNGAYDENLLPLIARAVASPGRHIVFVNLFGSHVRYEDRYPAAFATYRGSDSKSHIIATYDNSIRYTDTVLRRMLDLLRERRESSCLLYVSDHAEDVYDSTPDQYLFRSDSIATNPMYEVPLVTWFSPEYRRDNPDLVRTALAARTKKIQTVGLYHSLIDLARLSHPIYDDTRSIFSPTYQERERRVGSRERIYTK